MIKQNQKYLNRFLVIIDGIIIILSLTISWYIRFKSGWVHSGNYLLFRQYLKPVICITPMYIIIYNIFDLYTPHRLKSIYDEFINILKSNALGLLIFVMVLFLFKEIDYSRYLLLVFTIFNVVLTTLERVILRFFLRKLRKKGYNIKHIILVGYSELTLEFINRIKKNKHWGYELIGILDDKLYNKSYKYYGFPEEEAFDEIAASSYSKRIIGKISNLEEVLKQYEVDEIFITLDIREYEKLSGIINVCEKAGLRTEIIPDYYRYIPARPYVEELDGLPVINIRYVPLDNLVNKFTKRIFDIIISIIALTILSPFMFIVALMVKLTSPGPVFFKQERVGLNNKTFVMYKFRSMKVQKKDEEKSKWTTANDPRKTKFGSFLRKTSIDELPQLFNVLIGDMSLIGPRPERPYFVQKFREEIPKYMVKHQVRPGITGWAQVNGWRGDTSIKKRIQYDIYYIENWSFWFDVKILGFTIFKGFVNKNAY